MTSVVLWFFAALLALLIAAVSLPLQIRLRAKSSPQKRIQIDTTWFGGLSPAIRVVDSDRPKSKRKEKVRSPSTKRKTRTDKWKLARGLPTLIGDLLRQFRIMQVRAEGEFGFDDPADTGAVFGMLSPLVYGCPPASTISVDLRPVFGRPCLSGSLDAIIEVTPVTLIPPLLRYGLRIFGPRGSR